MDSVGLTPAKVAADTLMTNDSSAMAMGMTAMSDANILYMLDQSNVTDSTEGMIAANNGTSQYVKDFGHMMMNDHHSLRQDGQHFAAKAGVVPVAPANDKTKDEGAASIAKLESAPKGAAWDKAYIDDEVAGHQHVLAKLNSAMNATRNQQLKDLLNKASSKVQQHLDKALDVQKKMAIM